MNPSNEFLSLREISRRLDIPPSSVVYYKDRFSRFLPSPSGTGRRKKYPVRTLNLFQEIRRMFEKNWSTEQIEQELARHCTALLNAPPNDQQLDNRDSLAAAPSSQPIHELAAVLEKMSGLLENQTLFKAEIDILRQELVDLRQEKQDREKQHQRYIEAMEQELKELRLEKEDILAQLHHHLHSARNGSGLPPESLLKLPLVVRNEHGEYLGVAGKTKHFSLREFVNIIRKNSGADKNIALAWEQSPDGWSLAIHSQDRETGTSHKHVLEVAETMTPSNNRVARLTSLTIDNHIVPKPFLLILLKKIKDGFDE